MAPTSKSSTGSTTTPDTCLACTAYRTRHRTRRGDQLHRNRSHPRPARIHPHRQRNRIHRTIHPRPQRLRTPTRQPGHHPEKRSPRPPPDPRQNRTIPSNPQTLAPPRAPAPPPSPTCNNSSTNSPLSTTPNAHTAPYHRRTTPAQAYHARPKANPTNEPTGHFRIRHDTIDQFGKLTLRYGSRLHHLGTGKTNARTPYSSWPPQPPSPSSAKRATNSSPATPSTPTATTGATNKNTPADGRGDL